MKRTSNEDFIEFDCEFSRRGFDEVSESAIKEFVGRSVYFGDNHRTIGNVTAAKLEGQQIIGRIELRLDCCAAQHVDPHYLESLASESPLLLSSTTKWRRGKKVVVRFTGASFQGGASETASDEAPLPVLISSNVNVVGTAGGAPIVNAGRPVPKPKTISQKDLDLL